MGKKSKFPKKKKNVEVVFNQKKFVEFVTGFRKRKNERRKKAKLQIEELVKVERKRIRQEVKDNIKQFKKSYAPLPAEDDIMQQKEEEYDEPEVTVKIVELSTREMAKQGNLLGENCTNDTDDDDKSDEDIDENSEIDDDENIIPGMSMTKKKTKKTGISGHVSSKSISEASTATKRDLDRMKQKKTLKSIAKSKVFKIKDRQNQVENKKRAKRNKNNDIRQLKSQGRRTQKKPNFQRLNKLYGKNPHKKKK